MRGRADGSFLGVGIRLGSLGLGCTGLGGLLELGFEGEGERAGLGCVVSDSVSQSVRYFYVDETFMSMSNCCLFSCLNCLDAISRDTSSCRPHSARDHQAESPCTRTSKSTRFRPHESFAATARAETLPSRSVYSSDPSA